MLPEVNNRRLEMVKGSFRFNVNGEENETEDVPKEAVGAAVVEEAQIPPLETKNSHYTFRSGRESLQIM